MLQVLALTVLDIDHTGFHLLAKLNIFDNLFVASCELWQFEGLLESNNLTYSDLCQFDVLAGALFVLGYEEWSDVKLMIQRAGQWTSTCTLLKSAIEETQGPPHTRHQKRGGRHREHQC